MRFLSWLDVLISVSSRRRTNRGQPPSPRRRRPGSKPSVETLEDRSLPSFLAPVNYAAGPTPISCYAVVTADFNGDGRLDVVVANYSNNTVSILPGNADGTFQPALTSATGSGPQSVAVGDFNGDGKVDLATANLYDLSVLLGNGNGTFLAPISIDLCLGSILSSVAAGDFNADGKLDLAVTSNVYGYADYASVLLGNGAGGFSEPRTTDMLGYHSSAAIADFNADGKLDLVAVSIDGIEAVSVLLGDGSGTLQAAADFYTGGIPMAVAAGDVNGDGRADLVAVNAAAYGYNPRFGVLLGNGLGGFALVQNYFAYAGGYVLSTIVLEDFNNDGNPDIATVDPNSNNVIVVLGRGDGTFAPPRSSATDIYPQALATADFNSDGSLDAVTANGSNVSVLINDAHWPPADAPLVTISDVSVAEGNTGTLSATFTVSLSAAYGQPVTVNFATADGTATAGSDYQAKAGTLTFAPGQTSQAITVAVIGDRLPEPTETFVVNLNSPSNSIIADGRGVGAIVDDEPRISISDVTKREGKTGHTTLFTFTVTLSAAYDQAVTMSFRTVDGTATTADKDYVAQSGTITFNPGATTKTIIIVVNGDSKKEANETFYLDLFGNSSNSLFTKSRGTGTILNDD